MIANPSFGFLVSESGSGFTWSLNSHENQITPWSNDHVFDPPGEAIYIRDESTRRSLDAHGAADSRRNRHLHGAARSGLQPLPAWIARHRPGTAAIRARRRPHQDFAADPAKRFRIAPAAFPSRPMSNGCWAVRAAPPRLTSSRKSTRSRRRILARSAWNGEFGGRIAFADLRGQQTSCTGDRTEFLGRNGTAERPAALERSGALSGKVGRGAGSVCRAADCDRVASGRPRRSRFLPGPNGKQRTGSRVARGATGPPIWIKCSAKSRAAGMKSSAPCRSLLPIPAWMCC